MTTTVGRTDSHLVTDQQPASSTSSAESVDASNHNAPPSTYLSTRATRRTRSLFAASTTTVATVRASPALSDALIEIRPAPDAITRNSTCATSVHRCQ